jgi:predicted solute-binding protein
MVLLKRETVYQKHKKYVLSKIRKKFSLSPKEAEYYFENINPQYKEAIEMTIKLAIAAKKNYNINYPISYWYNL